MTAPKILCKRGTKQANDAYTGSPGEFTIDLSSKTLRLHDGVTPGGVVQISEENFNEVFLAHFPQLNPYDVDLVGGNIDGQNVLLETNGAPGWSNLLGEFALGTGGLFNNTAPSVADFRNGVRGYVFSRSSMKEVWTQFRVPHDYALGTKIYPNVQWAPSTTTTGTVRWGFEYSVAKSHGQGAASVFNPTSIVYVNTVIGSNSQYQCIHSEVAETGAIPTDKLEPDSLILMRVFRDATNSADTFNADIFAFAAGIHYQKSRFVTRNKAPNFYGT